MDIHLTKEQIAHRRAMGEARHRKEMKNMYENAVKKGEGGGTSITHEEQLNFKIALFPLIMQVIYNCEQLMAGDVHGTWYKFRDGDYTAAMYDCQTVLAFARRILGYEPQHRVEMANGEKRMFRILEGKDAKQIVSDFREYVAEADENDRAKRGALFNMRTEIERRDDEINRLKDRYLRVSQRKDNPMSSVQAYKSFKTMDDKLSALYDDMVNSVCMIKDHAEREALIGWTKAIRKEVERAHAKVEKFRTFLDNQGVYVFDKDGNIVEGELDNAAVEDDGEPVGKECRDE